MAGHPPPLADGAVDGKGTQRAVVLPLEGLRV